jgi:hypothetical protein
MKGFNALRVYRSRDEDEANEEGFYVDEFQCPEGLSVPGRTVAINLGSQVTIELRFNALRVYRSRDSKPSHAPRLMPSVSMP